jgi:acetylornithine deacetylase
MFKEKTMQEYKILKDLIAFNTIKDKENEAIINYIEGYLLKFNFKTEYKGKYLIMAIKENQKLGFLGHTDTVEYIEGWNTNPLELTKINNKLYGLGTCDMKGGIAAILEAVSQIDFTKLKYGMKLYFTYDEEIGFKGINDIVNSKEKFPELMIFGEPTNNDILVGNKGLLEYTLEFVGKKAHSSNPEKGVSANLNAIKFLFELSQFYEDNIKPFKEKCFDIPYTTMNVGILNGGSATNSIPASCNAKLDFRIVREEHIELIKTKINELSIEYKCNAKIFDCIPPFIDKTYIKENQKTANFLTEASLVKGSSRIILGPGPITPHEINEHITIESYDKLVEQYKELIIKTLS